MSEAWDPFEGRPERLGERYRLADVLGTGGAAVVYRAVDDEDGSEVAAKLVEAPALRRPLRFLAEVRDMARLRHPRVVPVLDAGQEGHFYWMVMPLLRGGSLKDVVANGGPLPPDRSLEIVFQVLQGVHAVHDAQLIHRDVKPHNVLLDDEGAAYLTDFGLARHLEGDVPYKTTTGETMGSPSYRAPEQARQAASAGVGADIYSVTAVLYWAMTGRRPKFFYMLEPDELEEAFADLPAAVRPVLERGTSFKPEGRYASARQMAEAVVTAYDAVHVGDDVASRWMAGFDGTEPPRGWWGRLTRWLTG